MLRLGVLDQSPIPDGASAGDALRNSIDLAQLAESLGYGRYWVAEHHNSGGLAGSAPEVLLATLAAHTDSIRLGSGGVMLSHYSAYKVAETFRMLHALYPGRIDLGLGRAPGSDQLTARALARTHALPAGDDFPQQLVELLAFLRDGFNPAHPFSAVTATPASVGGPEVWLLGSSNYSAAYAAHLGLPFAFADFINPGPGPQVMDYYRQRFAEEAGTDPAGGRTPALPQGLVALAVICADTEAEATRVASSLKLWRLRFERRGGSGTIPSVAEALAYPYRDDELATMAGRDRRLIVGDPDGVRSEVEKVAEAYGVEEVMVVTICHDHQARRRSYELLAEAFGLTGADRGPASGLQIGLAQGEEGPRS